MGQNISISGEGVRTNEGFTVLTWEFPESAAFIYTPHLVMINTETLSGTDHPVRASSPGGERPFLPFLHTFYDRRHLQTHLA